jgi:hypothetical protein
MRHEARDILNPARRSIPAITLPLLVLMGHAALHAQEANAPGETDRSTEMTLATIGIAETPYVDASFGFSIRPFDGADVTRQKRMTDTGDVELVQFFHVRLNWGMTVSLSQGAQAVSSESLLAGLEARLPNGATGCTVLRRDAFQHKGRAAARLAAECTVQKEPWLQQLAAVAFNDTEYFVILFNTPAKHRDKAERLFDEMIASFDVVRSEMSQAILQQALRRGETLLQHVARNGMLSRQLVKERYLRLVMDGRDAGFIWMTEFPAIQSKRDGVGLHEEAWIFEKDGRIVRQLNDMFLADDLTYERWRNGVQTLVPAQGTTPVQSLVTIEQAVRIDDTLQVAFSETPNADELADRAIETPHSYAPAAFLAMFPQLVDTSEPALYAFASYNSDRHGLVLRTLRVVGRQDLLVDGRSVRTTRIEDSEGLVPPIHEIYVDTDGRLVRIVAGELEMTATSKEQAEALYGEKIAAAEQTLRQLAGEAGPQAPRRKPTPRKSDGQRRP